ncbi:hypothetical protein [Frigidibacter sp. SD6-1]|uniref:hypothetical protein n=1 Tax=Frigidibacter sp. SD6-1 TaxID=3032581 RepID=UPI0024DFD43B|nr:hypothetical protein [Frigidibacter sp. SD6-1]
MIITTARSARPNSLTVTRMLAFVASTAILASAAEAGTSVQGKAQPDAQLWLAQAVIFGSGDEVVDMLVGLAHIGARLDVGMDLFNQGNEEAARGHFQAVAETTYPEFAAQFADRQMPAMADALADLATLGEPVEMSKKYLEVRKALSDAAIGLGATSDQQFAALAMEVEAVADALDKSVSGGRVTDPVAFQGAWGLLLAASASASQLASASEPSLRKSGTKASLLIDDLVVALPEANPSAPVELSSVTVREVAMEIKQMASAVAGQQGVATN